MSPLSALTSNLVLRVLGAINRKILTGFVLLEFSQDNFETDTPAIYLHLDSPTVNDVFQVFYDTGYGYRGADSILHDVIAVDGVEKLRFVLPDMPLDKLRIDLGAKSPSVNITQIDIVTSFRRFSLSPEEIKARIPPGLTYQISDVVIIENALVFEINGGDPQFFLNIGQENQDAQP